MTCNRQDPRRRLALKAAAAPAILAIVFLLSAAGDRAAFPTGFCLVKRLFGVPCPGCGITTSVMALLRGNFDDAVRANSAGPAVAAFFFAQLSLAFAAAGDVFDEQSILRWLRFTDRLLFVALLASWPAAVLI